jgi:hypothetical protein
MAPARPPPDLDRYIPGFSDLNRNDKPDALARALNGTLRDLVGRLKG